MLKIGGNWCSQTAHVLVGYNRIPKTGWLINNVHLFLTGQEAGRLLADLVSGKGLFSGS